MKQGLDADIASMSQAEKTMLRYQYVMANSVNSMGDFTRTADTWANSLRVLKQTLQQLGGTIGKAFVNMLKPAVQSLTRFLNTLIGLVEKAINAIGKLLGWQIRIDPVGSSFEDDAAGAADALDDAAGGAAGAAGGLEDAADAAKKLNKQLMAYDEINNITLKEDSDEGSGGSGGGGGGGGGASGGGAGAGGATGGGVTFEKYKSDISSWWELGRKIGDTLTEAMESIDWESIYRKAELFGRGLADFLNGLISPELFSALGATIAGALNTALIFLNTFGANFNWIEFGESLAAGLNRFFREFQFDTLGQAINNWVNGLFIALIRFMKKVDWKQIGTKLGEAMKEIDFVTIAGEIVEALYLAINAAFTVWKGSLDVAPLETALASIGGVALLLKFSPIKTVKKWFGTLHTAAKEFFDLIILQVQSGSFAGFLTNLDELGSSMSIFQSAVIGTTAGIIEFAGVEDGIQKLLDALIKQEGPWISEWEKYAVPIAEIGASVGAAELAFVTVFGVEAGTAVTAVGAFIGLVAGISEEINKIETESLNEKLKKAFVNDEGVPFNEIIDAINESILDMGNDITDTSGKYNELESAKGVINDLSSEINELSTALNTGYSTAEECVPKLQELYTQLADAISNKFSTATATLVTVLGDGGLVSRAFEATGNSIEETVQTLQENETEADKTVHELANTINDLYGQRLEHPELWTEEQQTQLNNAIIEMGKYSGTVSDVSKSLGELQSQAFTAGVNISSYFDDNGEFHIERFTEAVNSIVTSGKKVQDSLQTTIQQTAEMAEAVGDAGLAESIRTSVLGEALDMLGDDIGNKVIPAMDLLQQQLVDRGQQIVSDAVAEWDKMPKAQQLLLGYENAGNYAEAQLIDYKTTVLGPIADEIQTAYEDLGVDGKAWAQDAMEEIQKGLWEFKPGYDEEGFRNELYDQHVLKENYDQIYEELAEQQYGEKMAEITKDMMAGAVEGVEDNKDDLVSGFTGAFDDVEQGVRDVTETHSPSAVYKEIGMDMVEGATVGIKSKKNTFISAMEDLARDGVKSFRKALQEGVNDAVKNLTVPKVSASASSGMSGVMQSQMSTASSTVDTSMQAMFTDVLPQYFEETQWSGLFNTLQGTLTNGMSGITDWFDTSMESFFTTSVKPWFEEAKLTETIYKPLSENNRIAFEDFESWFDTSMTTWWDEDLGPWFAQDKWMMEFEPIHTAAEETFEKIRKTVKRIMRDISEDIHSSTEAIGKELDGINRSLKDTGELSNISVSVGTNGTKAYATGGFVEDGLFFANHNELVGRFNNGRTAVANNQQIIAGIQAGVYMAVRDAMNDSDGPSVQIVGDTNRIFRVMQDKSRQFKRSTGANAFT